MSIAVQLNIIEPWESGTESAIEAYIVKEKANGFLLFVKKDIIVRGEIAHYFICELTNENDKMFFRNGIKKFILLQWYLIKILLTNNKISRKYVVIGLIFYQVKSTVFRKGGSIH